MFGDSPYCVILNIKHKIVIYYWFVPMIIVYYVSCSQMITCIECEQYADLLKIASMMTTIKDTYPLKIAR